MKRLLPIIPLILVLGCASLYTGVVTITSVVDSAMKNWAQLSVAGSTSVAIDKEVVIAHDKYRAAAAVAQASLKAYKAGGNQLDYQNAMAAVRVAASGVLDLITPLVTPKQANTLNSNLAKATTL